MEGFRIAGLVGKPWRDFWVKNKTEVGICGASCGKWQRCRSSSGGSGFHCHQASRAQLWCHYGTILPPQLCGATSSHDTMAPDLRPRYYGRAHHRTTCMPHHSPHQSLLRRQLPIACYSATCGPRHAIPKR